MNSVLNFYASNLVWFIIGSVVSIFALIGFFADGGTNGRVLNKPQPNIHKPMQEETLDIEDLRLDVGNKSLNETINSEILDNVKTDNLKKSDNINSSVDDGYDRPLIEDDSPSSGFNS